MQPLRNITCNSSSHVEPMDEPWALCSLHLHPQARGEQWGNISKKLRGLCKVLQGPGSFLLLLFNLFLFNKG